MHNEKLYEAISPWLDIVDEQFALDEIEVSQRPRKAGFWLVNNAIKEVKGGSTDKFYDQEWFSIMMDLVFHWYTEKYGADLLKSKKDKISCLVQFRNSPILCEVTTTTSRVEVEGETAWLTFPDHLSQSGTDHGYSPKLKNDKGPSSHFRSQDHRKPSIHEASRPKSPQIKGARLDFLGKAFHAERP